MSVRSLDPKEVSAIASLVAERTGTALSRQQLLRLTTAIERLSAGRSERDYLAFLQSSRGAHELAELMSAVSVHKTDLFRDEGQLEAVKQKVLLPLAQTGRPIQVWSAGCSTGEEVATLLILLSEVQAHPASLVLGTDLSETALKSARPLCFAPEVLKRVPAKLRERYFEPTEDACFELDRALAHRARFTRHNLMDVPYPMPEMGRGFDLIFCRNVLIYFTADAFDHVVNHLTERLNPLGTMVLSAAEPLLGPRKELTMVRHAASFLYQRVDPLAPPPPSAPRPITRELPATPAPLAPPAPVPPKPAAALLPEPPAMRSARDEGLALFQLVLDWSAAGQGDAETEAGLRKCLYLLPELACARYLLGMILERRGAKPEAAAEYRRAVGSLTAGTATAAPFFLNNERLTSVCQLALARVNAL